MFQRPKPQSEFRRVMSEPEDTAGIAFEHLDWSMRDYMDAVESRLSQEQYDTILQILGPLARHRSGFGGIWDRLYRSVAPEVREQVWFDRILERAPDLWKRIDDCRRRHGLE